MSSQSLPTVAGLLASQRATVKVTDNELAELARNEIRGSACLSGSSVPGNSNCFYTEPKLCVDFAKNR